MRIERDTVRGDYRPASDVRIEGVVTNSLLVIAGVSVELGGRVQRDVIAYADGRVTVCEGAVVLGDVHNYGGSVEVIGKVQGRNYGVGQKRR
jgi:cytoskeletal protein CcmA (bactofilin family)